MWMQMSKRSRFTDDSAPSLAAAIEVLLRAQLVNDHSSSDADWQVLGSLLLTSRTVSVVVRHWLALALGDISRGHEGERPIPVRALHGDDAPIQLAASLPRSSLRALRSFRYIDKVVINVPRAHHQLPPESARRQRQTDALVPRVLRGRQVDLYAAHSTEVAWGVYASHAIPQGEYVGEYTGELISADEMRRRYADEYDKRRMNYVLVLREQVRARIHDSGDEGGALRVGCVRTNIDASTQGNFTRFMNHSCDPTLRVEAVRVDSFVPRLVFITDRDLTAGEQLTYDYGAVFRRDSEAEEETSDKLLRMPCRCGSARCTGVLPYDTSL